VVRATLVIFGAFFGGISDAYFREVTNMTKKLLLAAGSLLLLSGTVALQGCYDSRPDYYGGGYGGGYYSGGSGYYSEPYYTGGGHRDYDEHPNYWANHEAREERQEAHQQEERQEAAQRAENREERHEAHEAREASHHGDHDND
jgi:hypothetical protein